MHVRLGGPIRIIQFTNYPLDRIRPCFNLRLSDSQGTSAHRAATHIGIPSRCNWTTLIISLHHYLDMFSN